MTQHNAATKARKSRTSKNRDRLSPSSLRSAATSWPASDKGLFCFAAECRRGTALTRLTPRGPVMAFSMPLVWLTASITEPREADDLRADSIWLTFSSCDDTSVVSTLTDRGAGDRPTFFVCTPLPAPFSMACSKPLMKLRRLTVLMFRSCS